MKLRKKTKAPKRENLTWIEGLDYMKTERKLSEYKEYIYWAEKMGYSDIDLSEVKEVRYLMSENSAFSAWLNNPMGHAPNYWHRYGFRDPDQISLVLSINFQKICNWFQKQQNK